jgi:hypothetical protein
MSDALGKRCTLAMLASLTLAALMGLVAWGPVPLQPSTHTYADARSWRGLNNVFNVLVNLPLLAIGAWGWSATRMSRWPGHLRRPWRSFHLCVMLSAAMAAAYHAHPGDMLFLLSHIGMAWGMLMLSCGLLAERVDSRIGGVAACSVVGLLVAAVGGVPLLGASLTSAADLRGLLLLEIVPVLLLLTGVLSLPGVHTRRLDWMVVLSAYALSKLLDVGDAAIFDTTGWIGGHALMHLSLAFVAGWMAYRASMATDDASTDDDASPLSGTSQRQTSLNTSD